MALITTGTGTPPRIRSGDTVRWTLDYSDYPASTHSLVYKLISRDGDVTVTWRAAASGDLFAIDLTAAETSTLISGLWSYDIVITETSSRDTMRIDGGTMQVDPQPGSKAEKTFNQQIVETLEAYLAGNLKLGHESTTIRGQSISRLSMVEANVLLNEYRSKVQIEKMSDRSRRGLNSGMTGRIRFTR